MLIKLSNYDIVLERGLLDNIEKYIDINQRIVVFSDSGVPVQYINKLLDKFLSCNVKIIPQGEASKNIDIYSECISYLMNLNISRNDLIVSIGGGVVLDLIGFVASTYKRGIKFINIPTTTLSQIDSSIGGKVGINFNGVKNSVGSFCNPYKVLIDFNVLNTLEDRIFNEGIVEAIKIALIKDKKLFYLINNNDIKNNIEEIIYKSLLLKKEVVELDEKENNIRKILNFGHTIGHAYESYYEYKYNHGECVAMGILSILDDEYIKNVVKNLFIKLNIPVSNNANKDEVFKYLINDKKANNDNIDIIKVYEIGECSIVNVSIESLKDRCCLNEE